MEHKAARCPHPAGQTHVGDETTSGRMTIAAEGDWRLWIPEIYLVKEWWKGIAMLNSRAVAQRRLKGPGAGGVNRVNQTLAAIYRLCHPIRDTRKVDKRNGKHHRP